MFLSFLVLSFYCGWFLHSDGKVCIDFCLYVVMLVTIYIIFSPCMRLEVLQSNISDQACQSCAHAYIRALTNRHIKEICFEGFLHFQGLRTTHIWQHSQTFRAALNPFARTDKPSVIQPRGLLVLPLTLLVACNSVCISDCPHLTVQGHQNPLSLPACDLCIAESASGHKPNVLL